MELPKGSKPDYRDHWSPGGQLFFHYGKGYSVTNTIATICLGGEEDIKTYLNAGDNADKFTSSELEVLEQIRIYREEEGIGESNIGAAGLERAGTYGASRHKQKATRYAKARKRTPLRPPRQKRKVLSRR